MTKKENIAKAIGIFYDMKQKEVTKSPMGYILNHGKEACLCGLYAIKTNPDLPSYEVNAWSQSQMDFGDRIHSRLIDIHNAYALGNIKFEEMRALAIDYLYDQVNKR